MSELVLMLRAFFFFVEFGRMHILLLEHSHVRSFSALLHFDRATECISTFLGFVEFAACTVWRPRAFACKALFHAFVQTTFGAKAGFHMCLRSVFFQLWSCSSRCQIFWNLDIDAF
jgi:hypothetical protein